MAWDYVNAQGWEYMCSIIVQVSSISLWDIKMYTMPQKKKKKNIHPLENLGFYLIDYPSIHDFGQNFVLQAMLGSIEIWLQYRQTKSIHTAYKQRDVWMFLLVQGSVESCLNSAQRTSIDMLSQKRRRSRNLFICVQMSMSSMCMSWWPSWYLSIELNCVCEFCWQSFRNWY